MPVAARSIPDPTAESEAFQALLLLAERRTGRIPPDRLVRHVLSVTALAGWPVQRAALEAALRRLSAVKQDGLVVATAPSSAWAYSRRAARAPLLGRTRFSSSRSSRYGRPATVGTSSAIDNHRQERWKLPLPVFIEELYRKRFGRARPEFVLSIEEHARQQEKKKAEKREARLGRREAAAAEVGATAGTIVEPGLGLFSEEDSSS